MKSAKGKGKGRRGIPEGMRPELEIGLAQAIQHHLIQWYRMHRRDLPWRRRGDAYGIWVSEIMLQQTQVDTVIPYYHRFMARFPTVEALAEAPESDVLKHWAGLGYYARARNLQRGTQVVVADFNGKLPDTVPELRRIPGIGPYTAGAVASIAFNQRAAIVDGNVARVLSRLFCLDWDIKSSVGKKILWSLSEELVPEENASDFNQGLMELGALLCTPKSPACPRCPLLDDCQAGQAGVGTNYPVVAKAAAKSTPRVYCLILERGDRYWLARRPAQGLLGGMWEFPLFPEGDWPGILRDGAAKKLKLQPRGSFNPAQAEEALRWMVQSRCAIQLPPMQRLEAVGHIFTHIDLEVRPFICTLPEGEPSLLPLAKVGGPICNYERQGWISLPAFDDHPMGAIMVKLRKSLEERARQPRLF